MQFLLLWWVLLIIIITGSITDSFTDSLNIQESMDIGAVNFMTVPMFVDSLIFEIFEKSAIPYIREIYHPLKLRAL